MTIVTFRTECEADGRLIIDLLNATEIPFSDVALKVVSDDLTSEMKMIICTVDFTGNPLLSEIKSLIAAATNNVPELVDLHRCYQTLALGSQPNEEWSMHEGPKTIHEEITVSLETNQQQQGYEAYLGMCLQNNESSSIDHFKDFYREWCWEDNVENDLTSSAGSSPK